VKAREKMLAAELREEILEHPDGKKLLGGDNKTISRWWKSRQNVISGDISLSNNILN
jgi:hypothetical protein